MSSSLAGLSWLLSLIHPGAPGRRQQAGVGESAGEQGCGQTAPWRDIPQSQLEEEQWAVRWEEE